MMILKLVRFLFSLIKDLPMLALSLIPFAGFAVINKMKAQQAELELSNRRLAERARERDRMTAVIRAQGDVIRASDDVVLQELLAYVDENP